MHKRIINKNTKVFFALLALSLILIYTVIFHILPLNQSLTLNQNELESLNSELTEIQKDLNDNTSLLNRLQSGEIYELYNLDYAEAKSTVENETYISTNHSINSFKSKGINCALVQIIMGKYLNMLELVGFNTTDEGMIYFELNTQHQVIPVIGNRYIDCVVGRPYKISLFNDTIVDILTIW